MLRNLRVGTKLAAILLAPLVVLGVVAAVGVSERLDRAADARLTERQAELAARNATLLHALQIEQLWGSVVLATGGRSGVTDWDAAVVDSAAAYVDLQRAAGALDGVGADFEDRLGTVADRLASIDGLRESIRTRQASASASRDRYGQAQSALLALLDASAATPASVELGRSLQATAALAKGTVGAASSQAAFAALASNPALAGEELAELRVAAQDGLAQADRQYENFFEVADPEFRALLRNAQASGDAREVADLGQQLLLTPPAPAVADPAAPPPVDPIRFAEASVTSLGELLAVQDELAGDIFLSADAARRDAFRTVQLYLVGAVLGIVLAAAVAIAVARSITRPLRRLTEAAQQLATAQLPALVEQLRSPGDTVPTATRIEVASNDELGQLAQAFNTVQDVTVSVAAEQSTLLRKGISDIFVNLARRNQSLLDRQIEFIDTLEANEQDPDQLENLFKLDHLATRMRRNAESLLVLAGAEPTRRRGRPVPLADVVRVAVGEVADYSRISLLALDEVTVSSTAAVDLAHLIAELMDNATQFSPPDTVVEVVGHRTRDDAYVLSVSDSGIGMPPEQLTDANDVLANPPLMGLSLNRSLGFVVIGRLATRHSVSVRLTPSPSGGVTALVSLPAALLRVDASGAAPGLEPPTASFDQVLLPTGPTPVPAGGDEPGLVARNASAATAPAPTFGAPAAPVPAAEAAPAPNGRYGENGASQSRTSDSRAGESGANGQRRSLWSNDARPSSTDDAAAAVPVAPVPAFPAPAATPAAVPVDLPEEPAEAPSPFVTPVEPAPAEFTPAEFTPAEFTPVGFTPVVDVPDTPSHDDASAFDLPATPVAGRDLDEVLPLTVAEPETTFIPQVTPVGRGIDLDDTYVDVDSADGFDPFGAVPAAAPTGELPPPPPPPPPPAPVVAPAVAADAGSPGGLAEFESAPFVPVMEERHVGDSAGWGDLPSRTPATAPTVGTFAAAEADSFDRLPQRPTAPAAAAGAAADPTFEAAAPIPPGANPVPTGGAAPGGGPELTAAGLVRRSPRQQLRSAVRSGVEPEEIAPRVSASQRSPEEVRRMLSRYRSGLQRGRTGLPERPDQPGDVGGAGDASDPGAEARDRSDLAAGAFDDTVVSDAGTAGRPQPEDGAWRR